jgi:hypothetical protein
MTKSTLILGFICLSCLVETANAVNDRTQKLLETQSTNAPSANVGSQNSTPSSDINARPSYGPTRGVFSAPSTIGRAAVSVPPPKR